MPDLFPPPDTDDTPPDALGTARGLLITASSLGYGALKFKDSRGAHEIFACAARTVVLAASASPDVLQILRSAIERADLEPAAADRSAILGAVVTELLGEVVEDDDDRNRRASNPLERIQVLLTAAISLGAPAYNHGLHRGCYEVYAAVSRLCALRWPEPAAIQERLGKALNAAASAGNETRQAWLLREAFDEVLLLNPRPRHADISRREMRLLISMAVQLGAPAYNLGDRRGCYEIYAATARLLVQVVPADHPERGLLRNVLQNAALEPDVTEQAWMLRRTFDIILVADEQHD